MLLQRPVTRPPSVQWRLLMKCLINNDNSEDLSSKPFQRNTPTRPWRVSRNHRQSGGVRCVNRCSHFAAFRCCWRPLCLRHPSSLALCVSFSDCVSTSIGHRHWSEITLRRRIAYSHAHQHYHYIAPTQNVLISLTAAPLSVNKSRCISFPAPPWIRFSKQTLVHVQSVLMDLCAIGQALWGL